MAPQIFNFDSVFYGDVLQVDVFERAIRDTIDDVTKGYNGTIFAYGQTGAGKSFSMFGPENQWTTNEKLRGIVPRSCSRIFNFITENAGDGREFTIKCSFLEIYMEKVKDLLNPKNDKMQIRDDKTRGVFVEGLTELFVTCEQDVYDLITLGDEMRSKAATKMNANSSRSHTLFVLQLHQKFPDGSTKSGRLNLADLAGSESVGKTEATGQTLEEAKLINKSLVVLGRCIKALSERQKSVPFRESKLTFLLKDSLGGNSKTTLLIACSPSMWNIDETLSTLRFGASAKEIKNKVKINQQRSVAELEAIIGNLEKEIIRLKKLNSKFETELKNLGVDTEALRKAIMVELSAVPEEEDGMARTPSKSSGGSSSPNTPSRPSGASETLSAPSTPNVDSPRRSNGTHIEELALAELKIHLEKRIQDKEYKIQDLEEELITVKESLAETQKLRDDNVELQETKTRLEYEITQKDLELETSKTTLASLREQVEELEKQKQSKAEVDALKKDKDQLIADLEQAKRATDELRSQLRTSEATVEQAKIESDSLKTRLTELEKQESALSTQVGEFEQQQEGQNQQLRETQLNLKIMKQEKEVVEAALAAARQKIQHIEFQLDTDVKTTTHSQERAQESVGHLTDMNTKLTQDFDQLLDENTILSKKVTTFESELERLRGDIKLKDQALFNERARTKTSSDKLKLLSTQIHEMKLTQQSTKFQLELKLKEVELKYLTEQNQRLTSETQLQRFKRDLEEKDAKITHLNDLLAKTQREIKEERAKAAMATKQQQENGKRIKELEAALAARRQRGSVGAADAPGPAPAPSTEKETPVETLLKRQQMRKRSSLSIFRPVLAVPVGYSFAESLGSASGKAKEKTGYLLLQEGTTWVRRWCMARDGVLVAFANNKADGEPVDSIPLPDGLTMQRADRQTGKTNSFSLGKRFVVASNDDDFDEWIAWLGHLGYKLTE